jgi:putative ABC transport system permease protein
MIKNYFKIAWRNIVKNKVMFGINIAGLALGIGSCIIISLFVIDELNYDRFNAKAENIARVVLKANINGETINEAVVMAPVAQTFKNDLPEVLDATRLTNLYNPEISYRNTTFRDSKFAYVDPNFFSVFTLPIIEGNKINPLEEPNTIVISTKEAKKYFGEQSAIGKTLRLDNYDRQYTVTAIMEEVPRNSHFHFDLFASTEGYEAAKGTSWVNSDFFTYLLLKDDTDLKVLESKLPALIEKYMGPQIVDSQLGMSFADFTKNNKIGLFLQPLTDIHLKSDFINTSVLEQGGDIKYIYIFSAIALFMLLIACINFMNLSTASASKRAKEVGIRKVLGSNKQQLVVQFLAESIIATLLAMGIALVLVFVFLPVFNTISGKELDINYFLSPMAFFTLVVITLSVGFFAGGYPAFFLASFSPIKALKSKFSGFGKSKGIRSGLVVFQFVISAGLILSTLVVYQQMEFMQQQDLGYNKDQLLVLRNSYLLKENNSALKTILLKDPSVLNVTESAYVPAGPSDTSMSGIFLGETYVRRMFNYDVDEQYIPTLGMELVSGRNFSKDFGDEGNNAIINEEAVKILGFGEDALGKQFQRDTNDGMQTLTVIGVVKNFNFKSLHKRIDPLIMLHNPYGGLIVRAKVEDMSGLIDRVNTLWLTYSTKEDFSYTILDDSYNQQYLMEQKMGTMLSIFAIITILVACLGLFGLVTYTAEQRTKEIGIRKVLGSSVTQIVGLLTKDFIKLIAISFLIAFPLGFYLMNKWLQDFAYRIDISVWSMILSAMIIITVALLTISFKSIGAANANPINSLKTE